jgi:hypothetical protein
MERKSTPPNDGDPLRDPFVEAAGWDDDPLGPPPPPRGAGGGAGGRPPFDPAALFVLLDGLRRVVPRELEAQFTNVVREFLLTLRALIDWYLERLDRPPPEPRVEDIPID